MARKRMIDPSIWQDENFGHLSPKARILFIGLFSNADDEGRIRANDSYIRSTIFMYDDISLSSVRQLTDEVISTMKSVFLYETYGNRYIQLKKWGDYQKQREDRIQDSSLPSPKGATVRQVSDIRQTDDGQKSAQIRLDKVKLREVKVSMYTLSSPSLDDLTEDVITKISQDYKLPRAFVLSKADDLKNWCASKGKTYKDYPATLRNWVKKDAEKIVQAQRLPSKSFDAATEGGAHAIASP